jgi:hypothetical protein
MRWITAADAQGPIFRTKTAVKDNEPDGPATDVLLARSKDGKVESGLYSAGPSEQDIDSYPEDEFMFFIEGGVKLTSLDGTAMQGGGWGRRRDPARLERALVDSRLQEVLRDQRRWAVKVTPFEEISSTGCHSGHGEFMSNTINRRDFLGGTALIIAAGLTPLAQMRAEPGRYYPPALTGLRGSHPGSFEVAHQVGREGKSFDISGLAVEQSFDLVVVGGGISGLAAAWFYREAHGPNARILILENHDDFGGHAKRNEFRVGDRLLLGYGGTESLQSPKTLFSKTVNRLLHSLGVDLKRFETAFDRV